MKKIKEKLNGMTFTLLVALFIACVSQFQYGFSQNMLNSAEIFLPVYVPSNYSAGDDPIVVNNNNKTCAHLNEWFKDCIVLPSSLENTFFDPWNFLVSVLLIGGLIGSLVSLPISKLLGRKYSIFLLGFFYLVGYVFQVLLPTGFWTFLVGRFLVGIGAGISSSISSAYVNEISPPQLRGSFGYIFTLSINLGIVTCQLISLFTINGQLWRILFGILIFCSLLQIVLINFVPFSPRWLISIKCIDCFGFAKKNLKWLRHKKDVDEEFNLLVNPNKDNKKDLKMPKRVLIRNLFITVLLSFLQQFGGIKAISMYSTKIFITAGITFIPSNVITVILSAIRGVAVFISLFFVDKVGRKPMLLIGIGCECISLVCTSASLSAMTYGSGLGNVWTTIWGVISTIFVSIYAVTFAMAMGPIPTFVFGELFSTKIRPYAGTAATLTNYCSAFIITYLYPIMNSSMSQFSFLPFAFFLFFGFFLVLIFFKETKGKTIEQICYGIKIIPEEELKDIEKKEEDTTNDDGKDGDEKENNEEGIIEVKEEEKQDKEENKENEVPDEEEKKNDDEDKIEKLEKTEEEDFNNEEK